jgi:hypothetical protein
MGGKNCASTRPENRIARGEEELCRVLLAVPATLSMLISVEPTPLFCPASLARELPKQSAGDNFANRSEQIVKTPI